MLTCDDEIGADITELFNYLTTGFKPRRRYMKILTAPKACKQKLIENTDDAVARGVFGVPTFFVGDEMFFGKERLGQVIEAAGG